MWVRLRFWPLLFSIYTPFLHDHTESNGVKKYYLHAVNICMYICTYSAWTSSLNSGFAYPASYSILYFKKRFLLIFRERGREGERKGEKHQCVVVFCAPLLGTWTTTQACALTGNQTADPLVCRSLFIPLSCTSQG